MDLTIRKPQNSKENSEDFLYTTLKAHVIQEKNRKIGLYQNHSCCSSAIKSEKTRHSIGSCYKSPIHKGLRSGICRVLKTLTTKNPAKKWAKDMNRHFFRRDT
jgi:hypothetical protein